MRRRRKKKWEKEPDIVIVTIPKKVLKSIVVGSSSKTILSASNKIAPIVQSKFTQSIEPAKVITSLDWGSKP